MKYLLFFKMVLLLVNLEYAQATYTNPVHKGDFADPAIIRGHDGWFYAYGTNTSVREALTPLLVPFIKKNNSK